jgi:hypothetical protein
MWMQSPLLTLRASRPNSNARWGRVMKPVKQRILAECREWQGRASGPCWIWEGCRDSDGRGRIWFEGRSALVHRLAFEVWIGPANGEVLRTCNAPDCVNPDHLRLANDNAPLKKAA